MYLLPSPRCSQKNTGENANAKKVGLLNTPITVMVAMATQLDKECPGSDFLSLLNLTLSLIVSAAE